MSKLRTIWLSIKAVLGILPKNIEQYATDALVITSGIKRYLSSPLADIAVNLIPSNWDNELRQRMLTALETVIPALTIIDTCNGKPFDEMLQCWIKNLSTLPPSVQAAILQKCQSKLTAILDGNKERQNLYDLISQYVYSNVSKKNN